MFPSPHYIGGGAFGYGPTGPTGAVGPTGSIGNTGPQGTAAVASLSTGDITTALIADLAVTSAKLATGAVGNSQLAAGAVQTSNIVDSNVTAAKLASDAVTTAKILNANVTTAKIADLNVTSGKLATGAVGSSQIATGAVGTNQLATGGSLVLAADLYLAHTPTMATGAADKQYVDTGVASATGYAAALKAPADILLRCAPLATTGATGTYYDGVIVTRACALNTGGVVGYSVGTGASTSFDLYVNEVSKGTFNFASGNKTGAWTNSFSATTLATGDRVELVSSTVVPILRGLVMISLPATAALT